MQEAIKLSEENKCSNDEVLDLKCIDREETIKAFNKYIEKEDKINY